MLQEKTTGSGQQRTAYLRI